MTKLSTESSMIINAPAKAVYAVLADYRNTHPQVLPKKYFKSLEVVEGGVGAGTVFKSDVQVNGVKIKVHMIVAEPEPGRIITESDTLSSMVTSFTVTPVNDGQQAMVKIATEWDAKPGLAGLIDRLFTPGVMRGIYKKELIQLSEYMASHPAQVVA